MEPIGVQVAVLALFAFWFKEWVPRLGARVAMAPVQVRRPACKRCRWFC